MFTNSLSENVLVIENREHFSLVIRFYSENTAIKILCYIQP